MRFKLKRKTVDIRLKALFINDFFGGDGRDRGGKPLAFASQIPDLCPSCSAEANRTRRTDGSIPFEKVKQNKKSREAKLASLSWWSNIVYR